MLGESALGAFVIVHRLKLVYDGLDAAQHQMPQSLERQIADGMQRFVGAQLSYFVEGRVPDKIMDRTKYYQLHDFRQRPACWIAESNAVLATGVVATGYFLGSVAKDVAGDLLKEFVKNAVREFFVESYTDWKNRRLITHPSFERIEPVLSMPRANMPFVDIHEDQEAQKRRLFARMCDAMANITAPIHRAATHVDIWFDDVLLDRVESRFYSDDEIMEALLPLRDSPSCAHTYS